MEMKSTGEILIAFLAGTVVGAAVALMTAPQSGKRTRRQIKRTAEDVQSYLEDVGEDLMEKGRELIERGRETADETVKGIGKRVKQSAT